MTYDRLPYDDASSTAQMLADGAAAGRQLAGRRLAVPPQPAAARHGHADHGSGDRVVVSDELAALAADLELHVG